MTVRRKIRNDILEEIESMIPRVGFLKLTPQKRKGLVPVLVLASCLLAMAAAVPVTIHFSNVPRGGDVTRIRVFHLGDTCVGEFGQRITLKSYEIPDGSHLTVTVDLHLESYCVAKASRIALMFDPREDDYLYGKVFYCDFDSDEFAVANPGHDPQKEEAYAEEVVLPFLFEAAGYSLLDEDLRWAEYTFGFTDPNYHESLYQIIDKMEAREEK
ncbi:MAG: hypothetical protein IJS52_06665 [Bacilli bacterium]|nr:hypothetical protein [Bacilli bacterium]